MSDTQPKVVKDPCESVANPDDNISFMDLRGIYIPPNRLPEIYRAESRICCGTFGRVLLATDVESISGSTSVVIKCILKSLLQPRTVEMEIVVGTTCISEHMAKTIGWSEDPKFYYIVMEYVQGLNLRSFIQENKNFFSQNPTIAKEVVVKILRGLVDMHSHDIIHRDLKLENIMITPPSLDNCEWGVKLIDYGFSTRVSELEDSFPGTLNYIPPEAVHFILRKKRGPKMDIWALGVVIYLMYFEKFPYEVSTRVELIELMRDLIGRVKKIKFLRKLPETSDSNVLVLFEVMKVCFELNSDLRPSSAELLERLTSSI
jgi:serine/threonine protein kinase